ncbi:hypothetical protein L6452_38680 [Arctium lappa]|uniref:Uncharacterized protein n=1 Tax=Arctium lappa TaxID=4217 RepID=A0ACB8XQZ4_ARCLA|nr:hypothetical protein L6452_38680 [Arctium lappa]
MVHLLMDERRGLNPRMVDSQSTALIHLATSTPTPAQILKPDLSPEEPTLKGCKQRKVLTLSPTLFSDDAPWAKGGTILFLSSIVPIRTSGLVCFVLLSTQFSVFVRDHVGRKVVVEERL